MTFDGRFLAGRCESHLQPKASVNRLDQAERDQVLDKRSNVLAYLIFRAIERIENSPLEEVIVTNSIPLSQSGTACKKIKQLSVSRLLGEAVKRIHNSDSVSSLFV